MCSVAAREFRNKRAFFEYHILEKYEAGIALRGTEVKSIREGNVNLAESFARVMEGELYLVNCHIPEYRAGGWTNHDPRRPRKLLLHRRELDRLVGKIELKGLTLVPLRLYFNSRGYAKVEIGVAKGKKLHDKRSAVKERESEREIRRQMAGS
jgi:SsrA-binding protein